MLAAVFAVPATTNTIESDVLRLAHVIRPAVGRVARENPTIAKLDAVP
jgi:hypothetical protein